jgi:hypothetical protein
LPLAHDTDQHGLIGDLARHPATLLCLAERVSALRAPDATRQIGAELGALDRSRAQAELLLLRFTRDADAYVRRRVLLALTRSGSPHAPDPDGIERIWNSGVDGDAYGRVSALAPPESGGSLPASLA